MSQINSFKIIGFSTAKFNPISFGGGGGGLIQPPHPLGANTQYPNFSIYFFALWLFVYWSCVQLKKVLKKFWPPVKFELTIKKVEFIFLKSLKNWEKLFLKKYFTESKKWSKKTPQNHPKNWFDWQSQVILAISKGVMTIFHQLQTFKEIFHFQKPCLRQYFEVAIFI